LQRLVKRFAVLTSIVTGILAAPLAFGYVPPSQFIVKTWINKHQAAKTIKVRSVVATLEGGLPSATRIKVTTVFNAVTRELKSWASDEADRKLYGFEKRYYRLPPIAALLFDSEIRDVSHALREARIPIRTEDELLAMATEEERRASESQAFVRWKNTFAWVIGPADASLESYDPQLWFEKDSFLPLRLVYNHSGIGTLDTRFENYRYQHDFPYPRMVTPMRKGNDPLYREELLDVLVNPDAKELKAMTGSASGFTDAGNSASGGVRDLIQQYYGLLR